MIELIADEAGDRGAIYTEFLAALSTEHAYWMAGADALAPGSAHRRVVRLKDGTLLNRYWDDRNIPREESYREDVDTAKASGRPLRKSIETCAQRPRVAGTSAPAG